MKSKGIIFDFNGVLWWDGELQEESWRGFSTQLRGTPLSTEEMLEHVHGRSNAHTISYLTGREMSPAELHELTQQKESIYREMCLALGAGFVFSPGCVELFSFLKQHRIPHTIATGSERVNLEFFFAHFGLKRWFDLTKVVYDDGVILAKPAPEPYLKAAQLIGLVPEECIVVEDSSSGIKAAQAAQIGKIFAMGSKEKHGAWLDQGVVEAVIASLADFDPEQELIY